MQNINDMKLKQITEDGRDFLKVATSAPDFEDLDVEGIPDAHSGPTVVVKNYVTTTVTCAVGQATYFLCTPQGEVAFWTTTVATETDWINGQDLTPTNYPLALSIFPGLKATSPNSYGGSNTTQVSKGRLVNSAAEIVPLNNAFNRYGSISVWKVPLQVVNEQKELASTDGTATSIAINGIEGVRTAVVGSQAYTTAVRDGAYSVVLNTEDEFNFFPVRDAENSASTHNAYFSAPAAAPGVRAKFNGPLATWDNNYNTIVFRVDVPAGTVAQSFLLKRWVNVEYEPVFNSLLWTTSHNSPPFDPTAIALYRELNSQLPTAVPYRDNPDFWNRILSIIDEGSNILSFVPGPVGAVASGVHGIVSLLSKSRNKGRKGAATGKKARGQKYRGGRKKKK